VIRTDQHRQRGMDHWKGPHSKIISATPGFEEYRQIHLAVHAYEVSETLTFVKDGKELPHYQT
jgi:hypothetical protein